MYCAVVAAHPCHRTYLHLDVRELMSATYLRLSLMAPAADRADEPACFHHTEGVLGLFMVNGWMPILMRPSWKGMTRMIFSFFASFAGNEEQLFDWCLLPA